MMATFWVRVLSVFLLIGVLAMLVYGFFDAEAAAWSGCLMLAAWVLYEQLHLAAMLRWIRTFHLDQVPAGMGAWDDVYAGVYRHAKSLTRQQNQLAHALVAFRSAAQALPDGVITLNGSLQILWANDTAATHLGIQPQRDAGQNLLNLLRNPAFAQYIHDRQWDKPLILRGVRGAARVLSVQMVAYGDDQQLLLTRDVTQLEKLETMRRDFVANVSHELKTPLTVLAGFLETVAELPLEQEQRNQYLTLMQGQTARMQRIVEDLLTLSHLEAAPSAPLDELVDVPAMLARLRTDAQALSAGKHQITVSIDDSLKLYGAEVELTSAFGNLIFNAIRYTPVGGSIHIYWGRQPGAQHTAQQTGATTIRHQIVPVNMLLEGEGGAWFSVSDSGIGIEPKHLPRLTERFYRVDRSRSRETGGTGLGLAIVKHVLTRHGGQLAIESEPGKGSSFIAGFPKKRLKA